MEASVENFILLKQFFFSKFACKSDETELMNVTQFDEVFIRVLKPWGDMFIKAPLVTLVSNFINITMRRVWRLTKNKYSTLELKT